MKKFMIIACSVLIACFVWGIDLTNDSGKQVGIDTGTEEVEDASEPESIGINKNSESAVRIIRDGKTARSGIIRRGADIQQTMFGYNPKAIIVGSG